eukprot:TRINITY_DN4832_c2_g1_i1.p1 TRINITY_DN4832_c2_g1~~TRINITY_DN4832_c2_g1_i1.p1  ORF type:complete len:652 (-),score=247.12 TRINITY_DN4832_c2_g1_i1:68-2023(-)
MVFFVIFGILGVQMFGGKFYSCTDPEVMTIQACTGFFNATVDGSLVTEARRWVNAGSHFDDFLQSEMTLFEMASGEGWVDVLFNGVDVVGVGHAPMRNYSEINALYFVAFIIVGQFFVVNLFVGVVIDAFTKIKTQFNMKSALLSEKQLEWVKQTSQMISQTKPVPHLDIPKQSLRRYVFSFCMNHNFDYFISLCIVVNVVFMATRHYGMTAEFESMLETTNLVFTIIFAIEFVLKIIALYPRKYFVDPWNRLDFVIVVGSFLGIAFDFGAGASILRVFRISRILKLVRQAKGLRTLMRTLYIAIPSLGNIGALLTLLFFVYAVLGMNLFGTIKRQENLTRHANFERFGLSMLILFRISTGEGWNGIMRDCMVQPPDCDPTKDECGSQLLAPAFFVTFVILVTFVMLNLFVAVMLEVYDNMRNQDDNAVFAELRDRFGLIWSRFDPNATGIVFADKLLPMLEELGPPLGIDASLSRKDKLLALAEYDIPTDQNGNIMFKPTELALLEHASSDSHDMTIASLPENVRKQLKSTAVVAGANSGLRLRRRNQKGEILLSQYSQAELYAATVIISEWKLISKRRKARRELDKRRRERQYQLEAGEDDVLELEPTFDDLDEEKADEALDQLRALRAIKGFGRLSQDQEEDSDDGSS